MRATGGCHCGAIRFEVDLPEPLVALDCNCSICTKKGFLHVIVDKSAFRATDEESLLATYTFGTHVAKHHFCKRCGIHPFYVPRSHPDSIDVNLRALDTAPPATIEPFDGRHWEQQVETIR